MGKVKKKYTGNSKGRLISWWEAQNKQKIKKTQEIRYLLLVLTSFVCDPYLF